MPVLIIGVILLILAITIAAAYSAGLPQSAPRYKHNPNHPGITENGRDIICPKCKSPYCQYDYQTVQHSAAKTTYRVRPLHPFRPVKSTTREIPTFKTTVKQYRCTNCGWVFK